MAISVVITFSLRCLRPSVSSALKQLFHAEEAERRRERGDVAQPEMWLNLPYLPRLDKLLPLIKPFAKNLHA